MDVPKEFYLALARIAARDPDVDSLSLIREYENSSDKGTWFYDYPGLGRPPRLTPKGWEALNQYAEEQANGHTGESQDQPRAGVSVLGGAVAQDADGADN